MTAPPIFIVGVPRSGTTLLAAMLAAHSRLSCGPETHFFRRLSQVDPGRLFDATSWPQPAAEFISSITHTALLPGEKRTLLAKYQIGPQSVSEYLARKEPSIASILGSVTEQYMAARGKQRWVEKTPDHLLYLAPIRAHFPDSPVIRIVRDPRDAALSLTKVPWGVASFLEGLLYWERLDTLSRDFFEHDRRSHTLRFEDLISSPREALESVCRFVEEDFEEGMLDTSSTGVQINSRNAPWKGKVSQAPDVSRIAVWRSELTRAENQLAEALLGDRLRAWGYAQEEQFSRAGEIRPALDGAAKYAGALARLAASGVRFWPATPGEPTRVTVYLGDPGTRSWLGERRAERAKNLLPVLADVARAAVSSKELYWVPDGSADTWTGSASCVLRAVLSPYKLRSDASSPGVSRGEAPTEWPAAPVERKPLG